MARDDWAKLRAWALETEGSTRSAALLRIGLVITMWARWSDELLPLKHLSDGRWPMCVVYFVVTTFALIGLWTRIFVPLAAASALYLVYYVGHVKGVTAYAHHHTTLLAWAMVWLALTPCGKSYSVDRWLALRRGEAPEERGNLWGLRLMSLQVAAVYFWTAMAKCDRGFLSGARLANYAMKFYSGSSAIDEGALHVAFVVAAWMTVLLELSLAFGLFFRASRRWLVVPGLVLHGVFYVMLDVNTFTVTMWLMYLSFYEADDVHRLIDAVAGARALPREPAPSA